MNRMALICATLFVTACTFLSLFGVWSVVLVGLIFGLSSAVLFISYKRRGLKLTISAVLLVGTAFCLYLRLFVNSWGKELK